MSSEQSDSRPAGNGPATKSLGSNEIVPAELRRRREASRRMPALPFDHRRDPLDPPDSVRPAITCTLVRHSGLFSGDPAAVVAAARVTGARYMRLPRDPQVIQVKLDHVDDVCSRLRYGPGNRVVYVLDGPDAVVGAA